MRVRRDGKGNLLLHREKNNLIRRIKFVHRFAPTGGRQLDREVASDPEEPDTERGRTISVRGTCPLLEPMEVGKGGEERALGGVLGVVMAARSTSARMAPLRT